MSIFFQVAKLRFFTATHSEKVQRNKKAQSRKIPCFSVTLTATNRPWEFFQNKVQYCKNKMPCFSNKIPYCLCHLQKSENKAFTSVFRFASSTWQSETKFSPKTELLKTKQTGTPLLLPGVLLQKTQGLMLWYFSHRGVLGSDLLMFLRSPPFIASAFKCRINDRTFYIRQS